MATGIASLTIFFLEYFLYKKLVDPLFPSKRGTNLTAIRPCTGKAEQRIIFTGHIDAAWEATINYHFGGSVFVALGLLAALGVVYYCVLGILKCVSSGEWINIAGRFGLLFVPCWIGLFFMWNRHRIVPGANDNLTGCFLSIALMKALQDQKIEMEHTEVGVVLTGSEEAGLRGAKAWAKSHEQEYRDIATYMYTLDTICHPQFLSVNTRDMNGTVKLDQKMADMFVQAGYHSVSITAMDHHLEDYYHTRRDTPDRLDPVGIENCYAVMIQLLSKLGY